MEKNNKPLSRTDEIVVQETNGEILIYDLRDNKAFCLNETSALVWQACDGSRSVDEIREVVDGQTKSAFSDDLVWLALDQLKKEKLLENGDDLVSKFEGVSRRDVIKKIGLGSMVALPIIASLVAPPAAHAASCTGACTCTINGGAGIICTSPAQGSCSAGCVCRRDLAGNSTPGHCAL